MISPKKLLELINGNSKVAKYKINIKTSYVFILEELTLEKKDEENYLI